MQETHSCHETHKKWVEDFGKKNTLLFSHGKSNARGVAIGFCGNLDYDLKKSEIDSEGRFIIIEARIKNETYILVNFYNENEEVNQLKLFEKLELSLKKFDDINQKEIVLSGDFNFIFDVQLDAVGGNPKLKKNSIARFIKLKETYDLVDIWRVRNKNAKKYIFTQRHATGFLQRRLDFIFVSNGLQYAIKDVEIGTAFSSDHSPVKMSLLAPNSSKRGPGFWKFNKSILDDPVFTENAKKLLRDVKVSQSHSVHKQANFEYMKYESRKFCIQFSKAKAKERRKKQYDLEARLKVLEDSPNFFQNDEYIAKKRN
jgi:exonuclease III